MNNITLEKAFLKNFSGAVLRVPKQSHPIPNSVGSMIDPRDRPFCKLIRFKFRKKPSAYNIVNFLREYYDNIGWEHNIHAYNSGVVIISGSIWPADVNRCLCPAGIFEKDNSGFETNIFAYAVNPIIS